MFYCVIEEFENIVDTNETTLSHEFQLQIFDKKVVILCKMPAGIYEKYHLK